MSQTKREIEAVLAAAGTLPKHRFGQNFMIDQNLVRLVADAGRIVSGDCVIEVGPGTGTLTEELLSRGASVIAVEIDRDLAGALRTRLGGESRFQLIEGDALASKHSINPELFAAIQQGQQADPANPVKLVANLPYNIASPLVIELLLAGVELLAFTVQKEVADRLKAGAGDDAYGPLSVVAQLLGYVEVIRTLPPQAFWPAPKIESALVRIVRHTPSPSTPGEGRGEGSRGGPDGVAGDDALNEERHHKLPRLIRHETPHPNPLPAYRARELGAFVHAVFGYRRKTLRKALSQAGYDAAPILERTAFDGQRRPEEFTPAQFEAMFALIPAAANPPRR